MFRGSLNKDERKLIWRKLNPLDKEIVLIAHFLKKMCYLSTKEVDIAIECGYLNILQKCQVLYKYENWHLKQALQSGHFEIVKWFVNVHKLQCTKFFFRAACGGNLDIIKWAFVDGKDDIILTDIIQGGIRYGHIHIIQWVITINPHSFFDNLVMILDDSVHFNQLELLKCFKRTFNLLDFSDVALYACEYGNLDIFKWTLAVGNGWNRERCIQHAKKSILEYINKELV